MEQNAARLLKPPLPGDFNERLASLDHHAHPGHGLCRPKWTDSGFFLIWVTVFFFLLVAGLLTYFVVQYRRRGPNDRTPHITHHRGLEWPGQLIPLAPRDFHFLLGIPQLHGCAGQRPLTPMEIQVTAKKWVWQFEYPNGIRGDQRVARSPRQARETRDDVRGRDPQLLRPDVPRQAGRGAGHIHAALVPGYRSPACTWLQCTQYCGKGHSDMLAKIFVDDEKKYNDWLENGGDEGKRDAARCSSARYFMQSRGCQTCHSLDGTRGEGPSFKGVFGHAVKLSDGTARLMADENYRPRVHPAAAGKDRRWASSRSCPPSRACCASGKSRR